MDSLEELRDAICRVFKVWEAYPTSISKFRIQGACDTKNDLYTLTHVDFEEDRFKSSLLANLEIRNEKIWILSDTTEQGIGDALAAEGISKDHIVLAFYPESVRAHGEFAVS